jgi:hypothetical protein
MEGRGAEWRKSGYSQNGDCVEAWMARSYVDVRDSKDPARLVLRFSRPAWLGLMSRIKAGQIDMKAGGSR